MGDTLAWDTRHVWPERATVPPSALTLAEQPHRKAPPGKLLVATNHHM